MESVWSVSKLSTESIGSRLELVANCVHTADATKQFRRVGRRRCVLALGIITLSVVYLCCQATSETLASRLTQGTQAPLRRRLQFAPAAGRRRFL